MLSGYREAGGSLEEDLLDRCQRLSLLRLACIHARFDLADLAAQPW
ncbi:MAG: hypothetical protein M3N51_10720 [Actinomycetota bacterium]|nr:hypothetical protein [Actinomycetota bacterium]